MARVIILQRVVPHYRMPIYRRLADELGWEIVFGRNVASKNLELVSDAPFLHPVDYRPWSKAGTTRYIVPVSRILEKFKPDAIVAEGAPGMTSTWELGARRLLGGTTLMFWSIGYDPNSPREPDRLVSPYQWPYLLAYGLADAMILYGQEGVNFLRRFYPRKPMFVAANTLDMEELQQHRDSTTPAPRIGRPELLTVARLTPSKNVVGLVKSFLAFRRKFPDAALKIVGDGPDRPNVEAAAGDQLGRSVVMVGPSFDETETARHMLAADFFVVAGRVGLSINHALGYDLPTLAFDRGPNGPQHGSEFHYLIDGMTGFVVRDTTTTGLTRKLEELFSNNWDWKGKLRSGIRDFVRDQLAPDRMLDGFRAADAFVEARRSATN
jgi:glycosyltransferase involved in cell wall biosynthesis